MSATLDELLGALGGIPELPGAACRNRHQLFDNVDDPAGTEEAITICETACPALDACSRWYDSLPRRKRPVGVCAGRLNRPQREPDNAPRARAS